MIIVSCFLFIKDIDEIMATVNIAPIIQTNCFVFMFFLYL